MGVLYGCLHVVGPDHLGTLMTLSSCAPPGQAFWVGSAWGFGHCLGMCLVAIAFVLVNRLASVDTERWEHIGDYLIGVSMILCGLYFLLREAEHVQEKADGTYAVTGCAHCDSALAKKQEEAAAEECCPPCSGPDAGKGEAASDGAGTTTSGGGASQGLRYYGGAVVGVCQGACCPMGIVGMTFMVSLGTAGVVLFALTFAAVSVLGTGTVAAGWACLTTRGIGANLSPRLVYRACCAFTLSFGVAWITANYFGVLDRLNYAEHGAF